MIVKSKFICEQISISEGLELVAHKNATIQVLACYRSPKYSKEQSKTLIEEIADFINKNKKFQLWIGGDFNLADINFETRYVINSQSSKYVIYKFLEVIDDFYLEQLVTFTTWASSTIDLLLTNQPSLLKRCTSTLVFGGHKCTILSDI